MTVALWILSVPLIAEFVMAPVNLWTGRTMANFITYTGLAPGIARRVFAPAKLAGAILLAAGLAVPALGVAGALILAAVCAVYLLRLAAPGRRDAAGLAAFTVGLGCAIAVIVLRSVS